MTDGLALLDRLTALRKAVRRGEWVDVSQWGDVLDAAEEVATSRQPVPDAWRNLLCKPREGVRAARLSLASILTAVGRWDGHEDIDTLNKTVPRPFSAEALAEIGENPEISVFQRDLPVWGGPLVSIDGPAPLEVDDALWAALDGDDILLTIAIASPADFLPLRGRLQAEIARRAATLYHPRYVCPMLPDPLLQASSLLAGAQRPAVVTQLRVDASGVPKLVAITHALVTVGQAVDYALADRVLAGDVAARGEVGDEVATALHALASLCRRSEARRIGRGAWLLYRVATEVSCLPFAAPTAIGVDQGTMAHRMVGEAMVLCGWATAEFCSTHDLPAPYRRQERPKQPPLPPGLYTEPADIRAMIRHMSPAKAGIQPGPHATLGLDAYVQASSPLRRYLDLLVQQQLLSKLHGAALPHTAADVQRATSKAQSTMLRYRRSQRRAERYFTLLHLAQRGPSARVPAQLVTDLSRKGRHIAYIEELSIEVDLPAFAGDFGKRVLVELDEVDVFGGTARGHIVQ